MQRVDLVELEPLVDSQRAEDWMIEHLAGAERLLRARRGIIQPREIPRHGVHHRLQIELTCRDDVFRRLPAFRKQSQIDQRKLADALLEGGCGRQRRAFFETPLESFRGA